MISKIESSHEYFEANSIGTALKQACLAPYLQRLRKLNPFFLDVDHSMN